MRFSLYTEMQLHEGKTPEQLYGEVLEQIENADRLGYDCYAVDRALLLPEVLRSRRNPTALFAAAAQRTRQIRFRTMLHALPYHNPTGARARRSRATDILTGGRYEWGVGRGHGWIPREGGRPARRARAAAVRGGGRPALRGARQRAVLAPGEYFDVDDSHIVPFPERSFRVYLGGTSDRTYELAAEHGWGVAVPPLLPYKVLEQQLDLYREQVRRARQRAGHRLDPRVSPRRGPRDGAARGP